MSKSFYAWHNWKLVGFGVARLIYVNVDSPNLGFPFFNILGGCQWRKNTLYQIILHQSCRAFLGGVLPKTALEKSGCTTRIVAPVNCHSSKTSSLLCKLSHLHPLTKPCIRNPHALESWWSSYYVDSPNVNFFGLLFFGREFKQITLWTVHWI